MSETLPSVNKPSIGGRVIRGAARGTLSLGSRAFSAMFPTIGRAMATTRTVVGSDSINTSSEDITRNLHRQIGLTRRILDNQVEQNRLLERLLLVYKNRGQQAATLTTPPPPPGTGNYPGIDFPDVPMPDLPDRRQPPRPQPQQQRSQNRPRSWLRRYLTFVKRKSPLVYRAAARRIITAATAVAVPGLGWILAFINALGIAFLTFELIKLYREFIASNSEEEDENIESEVPTEEESAQAERELRERVERELFGNISELGVQEAEEVDAERVVRLQQAAQEQVRREQLGLAADLQDARRQQIMQNLARAEARLARANTPVNRTAVANIRTELENYNRANPPSQRDAETIAAAAPTRRTGPSREEIAAGRAAELQAALTAAQIETQTLESQLAVAAQSTNAASVGENPAVRVEGDTIIYDFERIKFEANLIKFDGLSLPTPQAVAEPAAAPPPAVPQAQTTAAVPSFGRPPSATEGAQTAPVGRQPPTASPLVQRMIDERRGGATPNAGSAAAAMQFFQSRGWTAAQAAGFAANLQVESNFNPAAVGDGGRAYGIAQWHPDRQAAFQRWSGRDIRGSTFEEQLEFMQFELTQGNERRAGTMIRQATTPEQAAAFIDQYYERSNGHARQRRMQLAASYASNMPVMAGQQPVPTPSSAPVLAQASTERVVADREQMRNTQILLDTFNARLNQRPAQQNEQAAVRQEKKQQQAAGEVPLRIRILEAFNYLAQAS